MLKKINILGIKITKANKIDILNQIQKIIKKNNKPAFVVTPNPEIILKAGKDEELFYILNKADIAVPDGFGLKLAGLLSGNNLKRLTGADLTKKILDWANKKKLKIGIFIP